MELSKTPVFCFTSDLEWGSESMITDLLSVFKGIPLTPFITHRSSVIEAKYGDCRRLVGLHPNFLLESTHGETLDDVVSHVLGLWPEARCFRSHSFYDHSYVGKAFYDRGFRYDSNLCLHLQPGLIPLLHSTGLIRYPVFLQDNHYAMREGVWAVSHIEDVIDTPGLKVFNFHPVHVALNTPDIEYYEDVKEDLVREDWMKHVYKGKGVRTFLIELIDLVKNKPGAGIYYLDDLHSILSGETISMQYERSNLEGKMKVIKKRYDALDSMDVYATSRDFNLREIEIDFILDHVEDGSRILDVGCGNGYTDIRIAQEKNVSIVGVDISAEMIDGARCLQDKLSDEMVGAICFQMGNVCMLDWPNDSFDLVISERCLLNLPDKHCQYEAIREVHRVLKGDGRFIMVEGTRDGLRRLNSLRVKVNLRPIEDRGEDNVTSLKFDEEELERFLSGYFREVRKQFFGMYYLISRVVHPLLVAPKQPRFDARINSVAREISRHGLDYANLGHVVGYVLQVVK